ncbi:NAD-dependent epimerase/dehydratase family protein [Candidatus Palauibacter sp.]|uniref:NAD-dependent epimerase/dehydratase family protein n=1 Tax=Candidatus Palauibacter sp. TaxID=3101350 RepID=UPI003B58D021
MTLGRRRPRGPVLVTGANGYVASWLVKRLLELGIDVHGTVRDPRDPARTGHLRTIARGRPGTLSLFRADLLDPDGFDRAMAGCPLVFHTASPLIVRDVDDPLRDLIEPATRGTRHVLEAAGRTGAVQRVVLTSSIVAIYGDAADLEQIEAGRFDESHWNTTSHEGHQPYSYSKTLSERLAWKMAEEQNRWDLVVVNPGLVLGPGLSRRTNAEGVLIMRDLGNGAHRVGAAELEFAIVDVRDVAEGHLQAGLVREAEGRYILVSETRSLIEIAGILRDRFGDRFPLPRRTVPPPMSISYAPLRGIPRAVAKRNVGYPLRFENARARTILGVAFRPVEETITSHFQQLLDDGLVSAPRGGRRGGKRPSP